MKWSIISGMSHGLMPNRQSVNTSNSSTTAKGVIRALDTYHRLSFEKISGKQGRMLETGASVIDRAPHAPQGGANRTISGGHWICYACGISRSKHGFWNRPISGFCRKRTWVNWRHNNPVSASLWGGGWRAVLLRHHFGAGLSVASVVPGYSRAVWLQSTTRTCRPVCHR